MEHKRWYDNDTNLQLLFKLLQKLPLEAQSTIGNDIIQILMNNKSYIDKFVNELEYVEPRNRWYDKSESLHSAIKMLKKLTLQEREQVLSEVFPTIVEFIKLHS